MVLEYGWWEGYVLYDGLVMVTYLPTSRLGLSLSLSRVQWCISVLGWRVGGVNLIGYNGSYGKCGTQGTHAVGLEWGTRMGTNREK